MDGKEGTVAQQIEWKFPPQLKNHVKSDVKRGEITGKISVSHRLWLLGTRGTEDGGAAAMELLRRDRAIRAIEPLLTETRAGGREETRGGPECSSRAANHDPFGE